jgi:hypothetical protein
MPRVQHRATKAILANFAQMEFRDVRTIPLAFDVGAAYGVSFEPRKG